MPKSAAAVIRATVQLGAGNTLEIVKQSGEPITLEDLWSPYTITKENAPSGKAFFVPKTKD